MSIEQLKELCENDNKWEAMAACTIQQCLILIAQQYWEVTDAHYWMLVNVD